MPYYHVQVSEVDEVYELNLARKTLLRCIVEPYLKNEEFICGGSRIVPSEIERIRISETGKPSKELIPEVRPKHVSILGMLGELSDEEIVMKEGKDVTRQFITHLPKTARQKLLKAPPRRSKNIFIVHGRDCEPVKNLKTMLTELGLNPIILHGQPSGSRTIPEKLEKYSNVGYAFVILTSDDAGYFLEDFLRWRRSVDDRMMIVHGPDPLKPRARQNVVLEFGYFMGLLGRDKVCCLCKGNVELPSDMHGIVYVPFRDSVNEVGDRIIKELESAGYELKTKRNDHHGQVAPEENGN